MEVGLLYSGGADSTLAACLLAPLCDLTLCCGSFGITDDVERARQTAERLGFRARRLDLDPTVAREAVDRIQADGYPRRGIQRVHEHALERAAVTFDAVADGTRRDDRAPTVERPLAQSIEDRHGVAHLAPLAGLGHGAVDALAGAHFDVETGPSAALSTGDYEAELRALLLERAGQTAVDAVFPAHTQSRVTGFADERAASLTGRQPDA